MKTKPKMINKPPTIKNDPSLIMLSTSVFQDSGRKFRIHKRIRLLNTTVQQHDPAMTINIPRSKLSFTIYTSGLNWLHLVNKTKLLGYVLNSFVPIVVCRVISIRATT